MTGQKKPPIYCQMDELLTLKVFQDGLGLTKRFPGWFKSGLCGFPSWFIVYRMTQRLFLGLGLNRKLLLTFYLTFQLEPMKIELLNKCKRRSVTTSLVWTEVRGQAWRKACCLPRHDEQQPTGWSIIQHACVFASCWILLVHRLGCRDNTAS